MAAKKLIVFLKEDGKIVSSLKVYGRRRRLVKRFSKHQWKGTGTIYVNECEEHDEKTPTIPLESFMFDIAIAGGKPMGVRRYCAICWTEVEEAPVEKALKKPQEDVKTIPI